MDKNFFSTTRILDGGMGQELLNRGVKPEGTLWGATALLHKKYHKIIVDTHLDFIKAGAEVIITNSFGSRKRRMIENGVLSKFKSANKMAGILAKKSSAKIEKKSFDSWKLTTATFYLFFRYGN